MIEVKRLQRVVRADAVARSLGAKTRALSGFIGEKTAMTVSGLDERVGLRFRNDKESLGHGRKG